MNSGINLTKEAISYIQKLGINNVYIDDGNNDIVLQEILDTPTRINLSQTLNKEFNNIKKTKRINEEAILTISNIIINNINTSENAFFLNNVTNISDELLLAHHSINVALLAVTIGKKKKYDDRKIQSLCIGALLHDVGKLVTDIHKDHPIEGYKLVKSVYLFTATTAASVKQHHEHIDGSGFPDKIKEEKILEITKIISICNEYINKLSIEGNTPQAILEILENLIAFTTIKFDIETLNAFKNSVYCYPNGLPVQLNNGFTGIVIKQNAGFPLRPIVKINKNDDQNNLDLMEELTIFIESVMN